MSSIIIDDRARVPFALIGILLLVSSAAFISTLGRPAETEPAVDVVMERTTADARAALRRAAVSASVAAANEPVVEPANTTYGRLLDTETAFRDALALRIYAAARERLQSVEQRRRGVRATASLPATPTPAAVERAIERVSLERAGEDGRAMTVTITGITVTATRGDRIVGEQRVNYTIRVESSVLAVHDRVERYQQRLDAGFGSAGLQRRLTAQLYAVAWARGWAQWGGAPIQNVVANRHIEVLTNGALLGLQSDVFGRSDPDGRRGRNVAAARILAEDLLGPATSGYPALKPLLTEKLRAATTGLETTDRYVERGEHAPTPNETTSVSVGPTADVAFRALVSQGRLNATLESVYSADIRPIGATETIDNETFDEPDRPGENWSRADTDIDVRVVRVRNATRGQPGPDITTPPGHHTLWRAERVVTIERVRTITWHRGAVFETTRATATERVRVTVTLAGQHATTSYAPGRPIASVHELGGPFDGPNLADIEANATRAVVTDNGGTDTLAAAAALGRLDTERTRITGQRPAELYGWVYRDLMALRERIKERAVTVRRGQLGTYQATPAERLAAQLAANRSRLIDAPGTYDSVAEKARVAARGRYLDAVIAGLRGRAAERRDRKQSLTDRLADVQGVTMGTLRQSLTAQRSAKRRLSTDTGIEMHVDGAPAYLTLRKIGHDRVPAVEPGTEVHPLVAENVNLFTLPQADVVDGILSKLLDGGSSSSETDLQTAAKALKAANRTSKSVDNATLRADRRRLMGVVADGLGRMEAAYRETLLRAGIDSYSARREIVSTAFDRWPTLHGRALAVTNGSAIPAITGAVIDRYPDRFDSRVRVDQLRLALRTQSRETRETKATVAGDVVKSTASTVKTVVRAEAADRLATKTTDRLDETIQRKFGRKVTQLPAGLPVAPVPGYWYATTNVWLTHVRGQYARFAVETPRRTAVTGDTSLQYVRDGDPVTFDLTGDGDPERLGNATRVTFDVQVPVVVVVPAGKTGVGDVNGQLIEQSSGWCLPGPTGREDAIKKRLAATIEQGEIDKREARRQFPCADQTLSGGDLTAGT